MLPLITGRSTLGIQYSIDVDRRVVITRISGTIRRRDLVLFFRDLTSNPRFDSSFCEFTEIEADATGELSFADLDRAGRIDPFSEASLRAVAVHADVDFGVARIYEVLHGGKIQVFRSVREAKTFLGLPME